ncbi:MAG: hypothetical protein ACFB0D_12645 [Phormidesmis sp.]
MSSKLLNRFAPTPEPLLQLVRQAVDDQHLQEIAHADYAQDVEKHLSALRQIKNGDIPAPMEWYPREVLELTRWTEPDQDLNLPKSQRMRGHWLRLFSCTILLHADVAPKNSEDCLWGSDETTIQLIESAKRLGAQTSEAALQFFCWCWQQEQLNEEDESRCFAFAILSLATALNNCDAATIDYFKTVLNGDDIPLFQWVKQSQRKAKWIQLADDLNISLQA